MSIEIDVNKQRIKLSLVEHRSFCQSKRWSHVMFLLQTRSDGSYSIVIYLWQIYIMNSATTSSGLFY